MMQDGNVTSAQSQQEFSNWLQRIGEGTETIYPQYGANAIHIPPDVCIGCMPQETIATLIERIYGHINDIPNSEDCTKYIVERAILTPLNEDVDAINKEITTNIVQQIDGSSMTTRKYFSVDTILEHDGNSMYPIQGYVYYK